MDQLLGTDYLRKFGTGNNTVDMMLPRMEQIATLHSIGVLIIDEIQHLDLAKSGGSEKMLNFFVTLVNTIGIPVILIGTTKALPILQGEFRQARRGSGQGDVLWDRMKNDGYWKLLMQGMWGLQWTKNEIPMTQELIDTIYDESQGIVDIAVKLYAMSQIKAIATGKEIITSAIIRQTSKESFGLVRPMIEALRSGNRDAILQYQDITPLDFDEMVSECISSIASFSKTKKNDDIKIIEEYAVLKLVELGIEAKLSKFCVQEVIEANEGNLDKLFIVKEAMKIAFEKEQNKSDEGISVKQVNTRLDAKDLRNIVTIGKKNSMSAYDALKNEGYIKNPIDEFIKRADEGA